MGRLTRIVLPGLVILALYYALFGGQYSIFELNSARSELEEATEELERLERENDSLKAWADSLSSDSSVLERFARERFGMIRQGEFLVRFTEDPDSADADTTGTAR